VHPGHDPPPQSVSVSVAFWTPSEQLGAAHVSAEQTRLEQSAATLQPCPVPHAPHVVPPQSMPVSAPVLTLSEQLGV
jgi:hypothetical protein